MSAKTSIEIAYATPAKQVILEREIEAGTSLREAVKQSGINQHFPEIDLERQKVGIFGKLTKLDAKIGEDTRVEIYREITADPELVERRDTPE